MYRSAWLAAVALPLTLVCGAARPDEPVGKVDKAAIRTAWKERQERIRTARFTLGEQRTTHRAYYAALQMPGSKQLQLPDRDRLIEYPSQVLLRGSEFRYAYAAKRWSTMAGKYEDVEYVAITTAEGQSFVDRRPGEPRPPQVSLSKRGGTSDETALSLLPLMFTTRPVEAYQRKVEDYSVGRTVPVDSRPCVELTRVMPDDRVEHLYLDPASEWVLRRLDHYVQGKLTKRVSAEYTSHPVAGWVPTKWTYVRQRPDGTPMESGQVTVSACEINSDITANDIREEYKPGTVVVDGTKEAGGATVEVIREDGSRGVAVPVSQRPSYEQLVAANESTYRTRLWLGAVGGIVVIVCVAAAVRHYRRKGATP